jgi:hypothetical protein
LSDSDVRDWLGTALGLQEFVRVARRVVGDGEFELLLRWASRREPHVSEAEFERAERLADAVGALLTRWEPVGDSVAARFAAESVERKRSSGQWWSDGCYPITGDRPEPHVARGTSPPR